MKKLEEAESLWRTRNEPKAAYGEVEFRLGQVYERLGRGREAAAHRQIALKIFEPARGHGALMPNQQTVYGKLTAR